MADRKPVTLYGKGLPPGGILEEEWLKLSARCKCCQTEAAIGKPQYCKECKTFTRPAYANPNKEGN